MDATPSKPTRMYSRRLPENHPNHNIPSGCKKFSEVNSYYKLNLASIKGVSECELTIMKIISIQAIITGKVQGVFYREGTRQKAESLDITGWVKNNKDGAVELHASGTADNIKLLIEWLWQGPPRAQVTHVDWQEIPAEKNNEFTVHR